MAMQYNTIQYKTELNIVEEIYKFANHELHQSVDDKWMSTRVVIENYR